MTTANAFNMHRRPTVAHSDSRRQEIASSVRALYFELYSDCTSWTNHFDETQARPRVVVVPNGEYLRDVACVNLSSTAASGVARVVELLPIVSSSGGGGGGESCSGRGPIPACTVLPLPTAVYAGS